MAYSAHSDPEDMKEHFDSESELESKVDRLVEMIENSEHMVVFTGAGISTSAGISDFRGPNGKWTCKAQGRKYKGGISGISAYPTPTHMALVQLQKENKLKWLISQNCDGLHRRSGFPSTHLSELHGNSNIEECEECGQQYFRDLRCKRMRKGRDHFTGRHCVRPGCRGRLISFTVDFGQDLPEQPIENATENSDIADLHLCLGSSLTVTPAADCPVSTKENGGNLVIVNLQNTPLTESADMHIYGRTDEVMTMVMERLGYVIPEFRLHRKLILGAVTDPEDEEKIILYARGADTEDPSLEMDFIQAMNWTQCNIRPIPFLALEHPLSEVTSDIPINSLTTRIQRDVIPYEENHYCDIEVELSFRGHYEEPDLTLELDATPLLDNGLRVEYLYTLEFNPYTKEWTAEAEISTVEDVVPERDNSFGESHKAYVMAGKPWRKISKNPKTRERAWARHVKSRSEEAARKALLELVET